MLSYLLYVTGYKLLRYRLTVVTDNLRGCFPHWPAERLRATIRTFYRWFFDTIANSLFAFLISERAAVRRCKVINTEIVRHLTESGRSFIVYGAHYGNWEMAALSFPSQFPTHTVMGIYSPLKNDFLNRLFTRNRSRTGTYLVSRRDVNDYFDHEPVSPSIDFFIADQSPSNARWQKLHWTTFLGRPTGFLAGPERHAVRYDRPVYYMNLRPAGRRGHFTGKLIPVTDTPRDEAPGFITERFARLLEREIERAPAYWLWTHRRWKRPAPAEVVERLEREPFLPPEYEV